MGDQFTRPLWAETIVGVWRAGWPVLLPLCGAILPAATGLSAGTGNAVAVAIVVAGSVTLPPRRYAALCVSTLVCAGAAWWHVGAGPLLVAVFADAAVSLPLVTAGRAVWVARRRTRLARVAAQSRLAVTARPLTRILQLDGSRSS